MSRSSIEGEDASGSHGFAFERGLVRGVSVSPLTPTIPTTATASIGTTSAP